MGSKTNPARVARAVSPPEQVAAVKAVACELPVRYGLPLGRFSRAELYRLVIELAVTEASASTIWRWLHEDAIKPWQQQCWIYRRDPAFASEKRAISEAIVGRACCSEPEGRATLCGWGRARVFVTENQKGGERLAKRLLP